MRFVTLFTRTENIHLLKDVGLIPYYLHRCCGVDTSIATYKNSDSYPYLNNEVRGLKLEFFPKSRLGKIWDGLRYLAKEGKKIDVLNLYHLNLSSFIWSIYFRLFCSKGKIFLKLDMDHFDLEKLQKPGPVCWVKKRTVDMAHLVTVESTWMQEQLKPLLKKKIVYLPNGAWQPPKADSFEKEKIILTVGRLGTEQKATEILLEAFAQADLDEEWKLVLAGSIEPEFEEKKDQFLRDHPELADRITFTGVVGKAELETLYHKAAIFALPSRWESFGIVLAEALFEGCYLIGSDCIPPLNDLIDGGRFGCAVRTGDVTDLAAALERCCTDEHLLESDLAAEAVAYAEQHFEWESIIEQFYRELRRVVGD
ncbi:MAG: glycosyltransferase family 4 protein [Lachnospiraceae bacterium]|nr:glycosyltransferase family 4 protein [Lachnospiraceae bacterium]